jgi:hypothetical protein
MKRISSYFAFEWMAIEALTAVAVATFAMIAYVVLTSAPIA